MFLPGMQTQNHFCDGVRDAELLVQLRHNEWWRSGNTIKVTAHLNSAKFQIPPKTSAQTVFSDLRFDTG